MQCSPGMLELGAFGAGPLCISQAGTIVAAALAAAASLIVTLVRMRFDSAERTARQKFEEAQKASQLAFEAAQGDSQRLFAKAQQDTLLAHVESEREKTAAFEARQAELLARLGESNDARQGRMRRELEEFLGRKEWLNARHEEWLTLAKSAEDALDPTMTGIEKAFEARPLLRRPGHG